MPVVIFIVGVVVVEVLVIEVLVIGVLAAVIAVVIFFAAAVDSKDTPVMYAYNPVAIVLSQGINQNTAQALLKLIIIINKKIGKFST